MAIEVVRKLIMCAQHAERGADHGDGRGGGGQLPQQQEAPRPGAAGGRTATCEVQVVSGEGLSPEYLKIDCEDASGREVRVGDL